MSDPRKHHYLPRFYLRRWAGDDGKVTEYRRPRSALVTKRQHPSATGYEIELYSVRTRTDPALRQQVETRVMRSVDDGAARALRHLESYGSPPDEGKMRSDWSRFIMSLLHRSPQRIAHLRDRVEEFTTETINEVEQRYDELRGPNDPPTFAEYYAVQENRSPEESLADLLPRVIDSELIGANLNAMHWGHATIEDRAGGFMTSDAPLLISDGLGPPNGFLILPTSPSSFFIATHNRAVGQAFVSQTDRALVKAFNDAVVRQAQRIVIAKDDRQNRFVDNRFLRAEPPANDFGLFRWNAP